LPANTIDVLRTTLSRLEEGADLGRGGSALAEIKKNLVRVIAEREVSKTAQREGTALEVLAEPGRTP
jgi:hypothetical protein